MLAKKSKVTKTKPKSSVNIVIDEENNLVFKTEKELYDHFSNDISTIESFVSRYHSESDIPESDFDKFDDHLEQTLNFPDEIWENNSLIQGTPICFYIRYFENEGILDNGVDLYYYLAVAKVTNNIPSFIYYHSPSKELEQISNFRQDELLYSRALSEVPLGAIEGDALWESDELAMGLYAAMLHLRSEGDINEEMFHQYSPFREPTIESSDEIWRHTDTVGNVLVSFISEHTETEFGTFYYIAVTVEDGGTDSHALLFSFPTTDSTLVDRYRHGENLQAEEVIQESSH